MISKGSTPVLTLVEKGTVDVDYPHEEYYMPSLPKREKPKAKGMYWLIIIFKFEGHSIKDWCIIPLFSTQKPPYVCITTISSTYRSQI